MNNKNNNKDNNINNTNINSDIKDNIFNENKIVFITGTPCTGKTTIANELNIILSKKYNSKLIEINELAIKNNLIQGENLEKGYKIVNIDKLCKKLNKVINSFFNENNLLKIAIVEGHLSHLCNIENNNVDAIDINTSTDFKVIVLRLNPDILQNRLKARDYLEDKIHENLEAEALAVCSVESYESHGKNVNEIDTTNLKMEDVLKLVEDVLFDKKEFPIGHVDFMHWVLD